MCILYSIHGAEHVLQWEIDSVQQALRGSDVLWLINLWDGRTSSHTYDDYIQLCLAVAHAELANSDIITRTDSYKSSASMLQRSSPLGQ